MLTSLVINNIVLISKAEIEFSDGLCVLTGETGSGKSILLDALGLVIGFRSSLRLIGIDDNKATISAEFVISNNKNCQNLLNENDLLDAKSPDLLRIRRIIYENSASKVFVNDVPIGVNLLAKIGENLVEIHGQHDQHGLLNTSSHLLILDQFASNENLLNNLKKNYDQLKEIDKKISDFKTKKDQIEKEKDYLEYTVRELENANLKDDEENDLIAKKNRLIAKEKILHFLDELKKQSLEASSNLFLAQKILIRNQGVISDFLSEQKDDFEKFSEIIDRQISDLDSAISSFGVVGKNISGDAEDRDEIEERLFFIRSLARKFNVSIDELPKIISTSQEKLLLLSAETELVSGLENQRRKLFDEYQKIATELTERRKKYSVALATKVEEELKFLKMGGTKFCVEVLTSRRTNDFNQVQEDQDSYGPLGYDRVRFTASINQNGFDDISKIASGGELSRFMLALKVALMNVDSASTMIFDEIDSGISGSTADAVGKRLKLLAQNFQVLVVTHQPQIAAKANVHFKISKISAAQKSKTIIEKLDSKSSEEEIARMLSGEKISSEALAAARSLINEPN